ncbi:hypothetical protein TNCV_1839221 [Trichonephila clavipes]|nr:hypothetical protein TNCV_1839221 [Trichonephila clavipes]
MTMPVTILYLRSSTTVAIMGKKTKEWTAVKTGGSILSSPVKKMLSSEYIRLTVSEMKKRGNKRPSNEQMP